MNIRLSSLRISILSLFCLIMINGYQPAQSLSPARDNDLRFNKIPKLWDEGLPLGNGMLGALIWQKGNALRFALDRADLWDLRGPKEFADPNFKFSWVIERVMKNDYKPVQDLMDVPYDRDATPTKIPAGALEFDIPGINDVDYSEVRLADAVAEIKLKNGILINSFVDASSSYGWIKFEGLEKEIAPRIDPPPFTSEKIEANSNSGPGGNDLMRLGYPAPIVTNAKNEINYIQKCYGDSEFKINVIWKYFNHTLFCAWTVTTSKPYPLYKQSRKISLNDITSSYYNASLKQHTGWWKKFWSKSSVHVPEKLIESQYYKELYKFGSTSRKGAPPITLQAIWTADNRRLPPWKGDFHNDLNTQLSYWPAYASNHPDEASVFTDWLLLCTPTAQKYTKNYFGKEGLDFPGVATIEGVEMGGWIQYSLSPTVSSWLAHHFYLEWKYGMDNKFLKEKAYPWIKKVAEFINNISIEENGRRKLPISSSPEINDNDLKAWFKETTNYDLSLIRWLYGAASEMAAALNLKEDAQKWNSILLKWPGLATSDKEEKLLVAPGYELKESHRHFSHLMAIHPLGILDAENEKDKNIIKASLKDIERLGPSLWCGYSYSWLSSMYARAYNGDKAAEALRIFASCFCSPNSFHLNGDQSKTGKSSFTYRPFTLEGNFAFAEGVHQMLLQSQNGLIKLFPAVPVDWKNASFTSLRTEGGFLISASLDNGRVSSFTLKSDKGGTVAIKNPFGTDKIKITGDINSKNVSDALIKVVTVKGKSFTITKL